MSLDKEEKISNISSEKEDSSVISEDIKALSVSVNNGSLINYNTSKDTYLVIKEIESLYQENISAYGEAIHLFNIRIEKLKSDIAVQSKIEEKVKKELFGLESIVLYKSNFFESLHQKLTEKTNLMLELMKEYKDILPEDQYRKKIMGKKQEIVEILEEILDEENSLLHTELERLNIASECSKVSKVMEELNTQLKFLEIEKSYFEANELQKISYLNIALDEKKIENSSKLVDTEIV